MIPPEDTIAAIATPPGAGGIGIVRISGPSALSIALRLAQTQDGHPLRELPPRRVRRGLVCGSEDGQPIDQVLWLYLPLPGSYTGEDTVEIQAHGGPVSLGEILAAVLAAGARLAEPGEFTKRAFLNGRMDLTAAEAVAGLINATSQAARRIALHQLRGGLADRIANLRAALIHAKAELEAAIDFPEEEDVAPFDGAGLALSIQEISTDISALIAGAASRRPLVEGVRCVIAGRSNVGKSSLLNRLLGLERAIVHHLPGTTRDTIEDSLQLEGILVRIIDTAGLRSEAGEVELAGIERTRAEVAAADLVLLILDQSQPLTVEDRTILAGLDRQRTILVLNKSDLAASWNPAVLGLEWAAVPAAVVSAKYNIGMDGLSAVIRNAVVARAETAEPAALMINMRHLIALQRTLEAVNRCRGALLNALPPEIAASDMQVALSSLGEITGETTPDEVLDVIFSSFCIGK